METISNSSPVSDSAFIDVRDTPETAIQYRFNGYQLNKIQLDATGASTYVVPVHQYYYNQPEYWKKPCYNRENSAVVIKGQVSDDFINNIPSDFENIIPKSKSIENKPKETIKKMLPL